MIKRICILVGILALLALPALAEEAVLYVNGEAVTWEEMDQSLQNTRLLNQQTSENLSEEEIQAREERLQQEALMTLISEKALIQEAKKRGLTPENEDVRALAVQKYENMLDSVKAYVLSAYPDLQGEELDDQVDSLLKTSGSSREEYWQIAVESAQMAALDEALGSELPQPEESVVAERYELIYLEQRERFADENAFEAAMLQGEIVVHRPAHLKIIQKAEFLFAEGAYGLISQTAAINPDLAEEMKADQYAQLEPLANNARAMVLSGEMSFAEVMEVCKEGSSGTVNYFNEASTRFSDDYYSRAEAFAQIGEVSTPYRMTNGYALLYYAGELPACDRVPMEEVYDEISALIAEERRSQWLTQAHTEIVLAAEITYPEG